MDFDDLTQHLLVAFLRNSTTNWAHLTRHDGYLARHTSVQGQDPPLPSIHSPTSQWSSIVSPLPTPQPFQSESAAQIQDFLPYGEQTNGNGTWTSDATIGRLFLFDFVLGIFLAIITIFTIIGNALVIAAILQERHLRSVGNYLVFSLAVADLAVACLVMPLGALVTITGEWTLGARLCDLWSVADITCCTASILHLLAIAMVSLSCCQLVTEGAGQRLNANKDNLTLRTVWGRLN